MWRGAFHSASGTVHPTDLCVGLGGRATDAVPLGLRGGAPRWLGAGSCSDPLVWRPARIPGCWVGPLLVLTAPAPRGSSYERRQARKTTLCSPFLLTLRLSEPPSPLWAVIIDAANQRSLDDYILSKVTVKEISTELSNIGSLYYIFHANPL